MLFPLLRRNALPHERVHVVFHIRQEDIQSTNSPLYRFTQHLSGKPTGHYLTNMHDEIRALLVGYTAVGIVGVLPLVERDH
jgi:hypothetical protein